ncbi:Outer membrane protein OmpA [Formosa sp. Hel1_31_208]|uniref:OmpA family protein n=1 Tax=Formosa sp. Hel1_31_208 TaxID=1798225 RepID=UPI00087A6DB7|nr:OmpA family protein [Formosa sp. Hel1_31_208]SDS28737.1 Outer membrane protein OmpA [Formosa sp. Hel1_31_208]
MMKSKFLILLFVFSSTFMVAQEKLADKFFSNFGYIKATELYEEVLKKGDTSLHVLTRLGDCYYNNSKSEKAAYWYDLALDKYGEQELHPEYIYKHIQSLRSQSKFEDAHLWMKKFTAIQNNDSRNKSYNPENIAKYDELSSSEKNQVVKLKNLPFNSKYSDFGTYIHDGQLYFASSRNTDEKKLYNWNQEPFLDIYQVEVTDDATNDTAYGSVGFISAEKVNTDFHEASVAITKDGKTMYFTRDNVSKNNKKLKYDKKGTTHLKLYKATFVGEQWTNVVELPFNDDIFSTGHPALSPDNKQLYFVSDREGGIGNTDIYVVDIDGDNYSEPRNLGDKINTEGREMFPFVAADGVFYFSSDGHLNLGFLDIFKSDILKDENAMPENLGAPYNSGFDDFAYFRNTSDSEHDNSGYFSSNRPDGQGSDDIYSFDASICLQKIEGVVRDLNTSQVLSGSTVQLINEVGKVIAEVETDDNGNYEFSADCNTNYTVIGSKKDYKDDQQKVVTDNENEKTTEVDLNLEPLIKDNQIVINPIFFDFDKWNIRTDAQYELENIVDVMRAHPSMVIKIEAHTDSRGRDSYNMKLSDRRAKSTKDYILSRGIAPERIESAIGYGESQLLNKCSNGVKCSKEEHQLNRRSYFYILKE